MTDNLPNAVSLTQELVRQETVVPIATPALDILEKYLSTAGFNITKLLFSEDGYADTDNLYAQIGSGEPHLCFAGHVDVVPAGAVEEWSHAPYSGTIDDGKLFGRGTADMKGGVACFVSAAIKYIAENPDFKGTLSFLITGDEEAVAINGTPKMLKWIEQEGIKIDHCIVGEPSNPSYLGEEIKVGRRGSMLGNLTLFGTQGHIAYPERADNPMPRLAAILDKLCNDTLDEGTNLFQPSNLEVTSVDVGNDAHNLLPQSIKVKFGIRYNNLHDFDSLEAVLKQKFDAVHDELGGRYEVEYFRSGEAFYTEDKMLTELVGKAVKNHTGHMPKLSTAGGTSDARFIKNLCPVVEFGLVGATMHKVDEHVDVEDIVVLADIYHEIIGNYFKAS